VTTVVHFHHSISTYRHVPLAHHTSGPAGRRALVASQPQRDTKTDHHHSHQRRCCQAGERRSLDLHRHDLMRSDHLEISCCLPHHQPSDRTTPSRPSDPFPKNTCYQRFTVTHLQPLDRWSNQAEGFPPFRRLAIRQPARATPTPAMTTAEGSGTIINIPVFSANVTYCPFCAPPTIAFEYQ